MDNCIFCQIKEGKIPGNFVYQDDDVMVIRDIHPQAPVHLLVIPKAHIGEFIEASETVVATLMSIAKKMIEQEKITNYRLVNNGRGVAVVDHLHIHILGKIDKLRSL
jgi:histidine triad (HIT) family protein